VEEPAKENMLFVLLLALEVKLRSHCTLAWQQSFELMYEYFHLNFNKLTSSIFFFF